MGTSLVVTVIGNDRPGIVERLSDVVLAAEANWEESRMARLAGQFAGILRVECPEAECDALLAALAGLEGQGISVLAKREMAAPAEKRETLTLDVVGNDRPGIIRSLSAAIAGAGGNVEDLATSLESAPMSGHPIFHAKGIVSIAANGDPAALIAAIENLGTDLSVSVES